MPNSVKGGRKIVTRDESAIALAKATAQNAVDELNRLETDHSVTWHLSRVQRKNRPPMVLPDDFAPNDGMGL